MQQFTRSDLEKIINDREFEKLVGEFESPWFECKGAPYLLEHPTQKAMLAKHISSFANLDGGYILVGVTVTEDRDHSGDKVEEIRPIPSSKFDEERYLKVADEWIYPKVIDLKVRWVETLSDPGKGVGIIEIPGQPEADKPFIYIYTCTNEEGKVHEVLFGYSERLRDTSPRMKREELQFALKHGQNLSGQIREMKSELRSEMKSMIEELGAEKAPPVSFNQLNDEQGEKIKKNLSDAGVSDQRMFILSGFIGSKNVPVTFEHPEIIIESLTKLTEGLRKGGWMVIYSAEIEKKTLVLLRTKRMDVRQLELHADGSLILASDINYLCFISGEQMGSSPRIVPIALVEVVYQFVNYFFNYISLMKLEPEQVFLRFDLRNMHKDGVKTILPTGSAMLNTMYRDVEALENDYSETIKVNLDNSNAVAVELLAKIYAAFGMTIGQVPFTTIDEAGGQTIEARFIDPPDEQS
jgi:Putative DNA-binding domain